MVEETREERMANNRKSKSSGGSAATGEKVAEDVISYDWRHYLKANPTCKAVPPWCFPHVRNL